MERIRAGVGLVKMWNITRRSPYIAVELRRPGFTSGWL